MVYTSTRDLFSCQNYLFNTKILEYFRKLSRGTFKCHPTIELSICQYKKLHVYYVLIIMFKIVFAQSLFSIAPELNYKFK